MVSEATFDLSIPVGAATFIEYPTRSSGFRCYTRAIHCPARSLASSGD